MSRRLAVAAMVALVGSMVMMAGSAPAQTGYPPGPCTATISAANAGNFTIGQTFTVTLAPTCAWTAGAAVSITVNGVAVGTKPALANGTIQVRIRVVSSTLLEFDDPVPVPAICGLNSIVAVGPSAVAQANASHTINFGVTCPATATRSGIAFTGANIMKLVAGAVAAVLFGTMLVSTARKRRQRVPETV